MQNANVNLTEMKKNINDRDKTPPQKPPAADPVKDCLVPTSQMLPPTVSVPLGGFYSKDSIVAIPGDADRTPFKRVLQPHRSLFNKDNGGVKRMKLKPSPNTPSLMPPPRIPLLVRSVRSAPKTLAGYPRVVQPGSLDCALMATSVCRVCRAANIRMLSIDNKNLLEIYEKLTNTKLNTETEDGMPSTLCYVCHRLLQRCYKFSHMAQKSNSILLKLLHNGTEVTRNARMLTLEITQNLLVSPTKYMCVNDDSDASTPASVKKEPEFIEINIEPLNFEALEDVGIHDYDTKDSKPSEEDNYFKTNPNNMHASFFCNICNKMFTSKFNLMNHLKLHAGEKSYSCNKCDKTFNNEINLKQHMLNHNEERPYSCSICDKNFTNLSRLNRHTQIHTRPKERPYSCKKCDKAYYDKQTLKQHNRLIHKKKVLYTCTKCDKVFSYKCSLKQHMHSHTGEKPYLCSRCDKAFILKSYLELHMRVHTGEKPYSCNRCQKAFTFKCGLMTHMRIHTGEKPYSCNICKKTFTVKCGLNSHMRVHTGERPYSCKRCDKAFAQKSDMIKHMRIHTGEKPFICDTCARAFIRKYDLKTHMKIHT